MTEIGCTYMALKEDSDSLASTTVGFPCENTEVKLVDKKGNIVPIGAEGELCVRSYAVTLGYWGEPEKTSEAMEQSRWFHTGLASILNTDIAFIAFSTSHMYNFINFRDIFTMTESGHGCFVGRIKEMVNRGGENVYPREVEDYLKTHPNIKEGKLTHFKLKDLDINILKCQHL